jgi:putative ABC transport system permease protein
VLLLTATGYIATWARTDPYLGRTVAIILGILSVLLVGVAVYVAAIVTANTFATIVAGRTRQIALMRLIGASARAQRRQVGRQGVGVGLIGPPPGSSWEPPSPPRSFVPPTHCCTSPSAMPCCSRCCCSRPPSWR